MDFNPKYSQPFTLGEALQLDIGTIAAEIARLQDSIQRLQATQDELKQFIQESGDEKPDQDLVDALNENDVVIKSQEERIGMLRIALERKGATHASNPHYAVASTVPSQPAVPRVEETRANGATNGNTQGQDDDGLYL